MSPHRAPGDVPPAPAPLETGDVYPADAPAPPARRPDARPASDAGHTLAPEDPPAPDDAPSAPAPPAGAVVGHTLAPAGAHPTMAPSDTWHDALLDTPRRDGAGSPSTDDAAPSEAPPTPAPMTPRSPKALRPGGRLGRWVLEGVIGEGATAAVWSAHHEQLGAPVAIKVFHPQRMSFGTVLGEARAAAGIPSKHVIWVYDVDTFDGHHAIVMELCASGPKVATSLRDTPIDGPEHAATLMAQAARGVAEAHASAIFHKDIKPANILVNPGDGRAQITDFGLANPALWRRTRGTGGRSAESTVALDGLVEAPAHVADPHALIRGAVRVGTPEYMAPEQAGGLRGDLDPRNPTHARYLRAIDVYGLGATLYALLAGHPPFPHGDLDPATATAEQIMRQVLQGPPPPLSQVAPTVPGRLARICDKAMARDPLDRHPTAEALADDLEAFVALRPTSVDTSPLVRAAVHVRRERASVSLLALLAVVTLASFAVVWSNGQRITAQQAALDEQRIELEVLEASRDALSQSLANTTETLAITRTELASKDGELASKGRALAERTRALRDVSGRLQSTEADLTTLSTELEQAQSRVSELETVELRMMEELDATRQQLTTLRTDLDQAEDVLSDVRTELVAELSRSDSLAQKVSELQTTLATGREAYAALSADKAAQQAELDQLRGVLADVRANMRELRAENQHLRRILRSPAGQGRDATVPPEPSAPPLPGPTEAPDDGQAAGALDQPPVGGQVPADDGPAWRITPLSSGGIRR